MISVEEAIQLIDKNVNPSETELISINYSLGYILSNNVYAVLDLPRFDNSSMDGYALGNTNTDKHYKIVGEITAGSDPSKFNLQEFEAARIYTGAQIPAGTKAVVMQEKVTKSNGSIIIEGEIKLNENIRFKGEEITKGNLLLKKGHKVNPATISLLASMGVSAIEVFRMPKVGLLNTGNELVPIGKKLGPGKIFESNSYAIKSLLKSNGIKEIVHKKISDNYTETLEVIKAVLNSCDILIITGGISVGEYDFVGKALMEIGINQVFYKVNQKPGKPIFFGTLNKRKKIIALPGNPAASLTCFYIYVSRILNRYKGNLKINKPIKLSCKENIQIKGNRAVFLKAITDENKVTILDGQKSSMMVSFSEANSLVYIPSSKNFISKGELVDVYLLPNFYNW